MTAVSFIVTLLFAIIMLGALACQVYVSTKVFKEAGNAQVLRGVLRGTRTFIRGWQRADELGIKDIMIFWSILVALLVIFMGIFLIIFVANGPPSR